MITSLISKRKYTYIASAILVVVSVVALSIWGLRLGIDFRGGTLLEVVFSREISREDIQNALSDSNLTDVSVQTGDENGAIIRYLASDESANERVRESLAQLDENGEIVRTDFFGASVSKELARKAIEAVLVASVVIALYIAWAFRKVSRPVSPWQYGVGALIALAHDAVIVLGAFAFFGEFFSLEVGIPFVAALLTVLGYSVNDTIVVYDRVRENLIRSKKKESFESLVGRSVGETLARSVNTSLTVVLTLVAILIFGGESIRAFSLALLIGVIAGTYSSIFVASASLVTSYVYRVKRRI
jgi:preprotein translocase subunit SecF